MYRLNEPGFALCSLKSLGYMQIVLDNLKRFRYITEHGNNTNDQRNSNMPFPA